MLLFISSRALALNTDALTTPLTTLSGNTVNLQQYRDHKPMYIKFWATWCQPCRAQMPHFQQTQNSYGKDIHIIAVNMGINEETKYIRNIQQQYQLSMPLAIDSSGQLARTFNVIATPYHILIDGNGRIVHQGHEASAQLDDKIKALANHSTTGLPPLDIAVPEKTKLPVQHDNKKISAMLFVATWCDWYLQDSRPAISQNCIAAQKHISELAGTYPEFNWTGIVSRLWTGNKELAAYREKYRIGYPLVLDNDNTLFLRHRIRDFPTLILLRDGREVLRIRQFTDTRQLAAKLQPYR